MIGADASADMLMEAMDKAAASGLAVRPLFINQAAGELDLYGTVDAAVSSLDSLNYVPPEELREAFRRLRLFIRPGGLLLFDLRTPGFLRSMDGSVSVDETEDVFCLWRGRFDSELGALRYGMDIFEREGALWRRSGEGARRIRPRAGYARLLAGGGGVHGHLRLQRRADRRRRARIFQSKKRNRLNGRDHQGRHRGRLCENILHHRPRHRGAREADTRPGADGSRRARAHALRGQYAGRADEGGGREPHHPRQRRRAHRQRDRRGGLRRLRARVCR